MPATSTIQHKGFIESISEEGMRVKFTSHSACGDCHAKGLCSASEMKDKEVIVKNTSDNYIVGEPVNILMTINQGTRAVLIGYVYPFLLFLFSLLILSALGLGEVNSGVFSLSLLIPYYLSIYIFRDKINQKFIFSVRKEG